MPRRKRSGARMQDDEVDHVNQQTPSKRRRTNAGVVAVAAPAPAPAVVVASAPHQPPAPVFAPPAPAPAPKLAPKPKPKPRPKPKPTAKRAPLPAQARGKPNWTSIIREASPVKKNDRKIYFPEQLYLALEAETARDSEHMGWVNDGDPREFFFCKEDDMVLMTLASHDIHYKHILSFVKQLNSYHFERTQDGRSCDGKRTVGNRFRHESSRLFISGKSPSEACSEVKIRARPRPRKAERGTSGPSSPAPTMVPAPKSKPKAAPSTSTSTSKVAVPLPVKGSQRKASTSRKKVSQPRRPTTATRKVVASVPKQTPKPYDASISFSPPLERSYSRFAREFSTGATPPPETEREPESMARNSFFPAISTKRNGRFAWPEHKSSHRDVQEEEEQHDQWEDVSVGSVQIVPSSEDEDEDMDEDMGSEISCGQDLGSSTSFFNVQQTSNNTSPNRANLYDNDDPPPPTRLPKIIPPRKIRRVNGHVNGGYGWIDEREQLPFLIEYDFVPPRPTPARAMKIATTPDVKFEFEEVYNRGLSFAMDLNPGSSRL